MSWRPIARLNKLKTFAFSYNMANPSKPNFDDKSLFAKFELNFWSSVDRKQHINIPFKIEVIDNIMYLKCTINDNEKVYYSSPFHKESISFKEIESLSFELIKYSIQESIDKN